MSKKVYERGLDKLEPGQLIVIKFPGAMGNTINQNSNDEEKEQKLKEYVEACPCLPAVILKRNHTTLIHGSVNYDVGFISRWMSSGGLSGLITLKDIPIWRYFAKKENDPVEGIPPTWLINNIKENIEDKNSKSYFDDLIDDELFYVVDSDYVDEDGNNNYVERVYLKEKKLSENN